MEEEVESVLIDEAHGDVVSLTWKTLDVQKQTDLCQSDEAGAVSLFLGTTRNNFEGKQVISLQYEAYDEMALKEMKAICAKVRAQWHVTRIVIQHKLGDCPIGHVSVLIAVSSEHRKESLQAVQFAIDELKSTVPIWKKELYKDGGESWKKNQEFTPIFPPTSSTAKVAASSDNTGEVILRELDACFEQDADIDELGIIMAPPPPAIVLIEHKLGISVGALKPLYAFAIDRFHQQVSSLKQRLLQEQELQRKQESEREQNIAMHWQEAASTLSSVTRAALVVRGDLPMAFNYRKELLLRNLLDCGVELRLLQMLFTKHPKSPSGWQHRRWCLKLRFDQARGKQGGEACLSLTSQELSVEQELCRNMAEIYPKNYYAWMHRLWLLQFLDTAQIKEEMAFTKSWLTTHVSDHSASNHREQVVLRLLKEIAADADQELSLIDGALTDSLELILSRPGHETLWYHRRMLAELLLNKALSSIETREISSKSSSTEEEETYFTESDFRLEGQVLHVEKEQEQEAEVVWGGGGEQRPQGSAAFYSLHKHLLALNTVGALNAARGKEAGALFAWLASWLKQEMLLVRHCTQDIDAWNFQKQRHMAMRYGAFIFERAILCLFPPRGTSSPSFSSLAHLHEAAVFAKAETTRSSRQTQHFLTCCISALRAIVQKVESEDTFERAWSTIEARLGSNISM